MPGRLIVFEGVEGSGKTSQIRQLETWLCESKTLQRLHQQGTVSQVIATREPGGTALGQKLRHLLLHPDEEMMQDRTELLLYAADRAQHVAGFLKPQLAQGAVILCDRFTDSTIAYQGYGRNLDRALIDQLNQIATNGLQSDLTLWLDVDVEIGLSRAQRRGAIDRIEQATLTFHHRVQQGFIELAKAFPDRIVRIDASLSPPKVANQIQAVVEARLREWYGAED
ncbi:MAG TPA: dTMP kinase [Trichocoleus sp.]|jgi:dTMP kinase